MFNSCNNGCGCGDWGNGIWGCLLSLIILIVVLEFLGSIIGCNSIGGACTGNMGCGCNGNGYNTANSCGNSCGCNNNCGCNNGCF